jgi:hypothetical protein
MGSGSGATAVWAAATGWTTAVFETVAFGFATSDFPRSDPIKVWAETFTTISGGHYMGLHSGVDRPGVGIFKLFKLTMSETKIF